MPIFRRSRRVLNYRYIFSLFFYALEYGDFQVDLGALPVHNDGFDYAVQVAAEFFAVTGVELLADLFDSGA